MKNEYTKYIVKSLVISLVISFLIEIFICNFRHFESYFYSDMLELTYEIGEGLECNSKNVCNIKDEEEAYIEILDIDKEINNLYLSVSNDEENARVVFDIYISDDANELYFFASERTIIEYSKRGDYIKINASGNVHSLKLYITDANSEEFKIDDVKANVKVPLMFSIIRFSFFTLLIFCILFIRFSSPFAKIKFDNKKAIITYVALGFILSIIGFGLCSLNSYIRQETSMTHNQAQYKNLAEALADGHFYLNFEASEELLSLSNPYDKYYRDSLLKVQEDYYWDYAFYDGKYYSYFGVLPCLIIYLPYYLITGSHVSNITAVSIILSIYIFSCIYLCFTLCKKYFKNTSFTWFLLITFGLLILSSGFFYASSYPGFYYEPIFLAVALAMVGLAFWIKASTNKLNKKYLALGSFMVALTSLCRPQILISMFFAIPIFWDYIKRRELFSKKSIKETLCFLLPFVIVGLSLMYYNYARFGSIFDFGASYNLTTNDMTKRGFNFDRVFLGVYSYLFEPAHISLIFPFIETYLPSTSYVGVTISETMHGGFFFTNFICILSLFFWKFKKIINNKTLYNICLYSLIFSLIIIIVDTEMSGILARYICDFSWLLTLSTIIILFAVINKVKNKDILKLIVLFIMLALLCNILVFFTEPLLWKWNHNVFWAIYYEVFMFWV